MINNTTKNEKKAGGRPTVGVAAEQARQQLVQLRESGKRSKLQAQAQCDEQKRILTLTSEWNRYTSTGAERKEERRITFALGRLVLESLAHEGAIKAVVGPTEIASLNAEIRETLAKYITRRQHPKYPVDTTASHSSAGSSRG